MGALVGRINGTTFHIGTSSGTIIAPASGNLELWMNDNTLSYSDNTGYLDVYVEGHDYY
jgi:hypothetical protein